MHMHMHNALALAHAMRTRTRRYAVYTSKLMNLDADTSSDADDVAYSNVNCPSLAVS